MANPNATVLRDMFLWSDFTPGNPTTGGTFTGSLPNVSVSPAGLLSLNTTTGLISVGLPPVPAGYSFWACVMAVTLEAVGINAVPVMETPIYCSIVPIGITSTVIFNDSDWGNLNGYSGTSGTFMTTHHGVYDDSGEVNFTITTMNIQTLSQMATDVNHKMHILFDAVAI